ncbi:hypothetical protein NDU88_003702 [Pleurodeles waltl]|uniref:Uncharacterized protein n=1 Tax=Pleurodeles waltl TaxID=8319 RepID=A0AAV7RFZ1_PLEWA|nr:hypothetical protein NDU88_003702 [Pleurodeles waltl]
MDSTDSTGRVMAASIAIHHRAWLAASNFSPPVRDALLDMPLYDKSLFGAHVEYALHRFRDSHGGDWYPSQLSHVLACCDFLGTVMFL